MNITAFEIYFVMIADSVSVFLTLVFFGGMIFSAILTAIRGVKRSDGDDVSHIQPKRFFVPALIAGIIATFLPSTKTLCLMIVVPQMANSEVIRKDIPEVYNMAIEKLKEQLAPSKEVEKK